MTLPPRRRLAPIHRVGLLPTPFLLLAVIGGCTDAEWSYRPRTDSGDASAITADAVSLDRPVVAPDGGRDATLPDGPSPDLPALDAPALDIPALDVLALDGSPPDSGTPDAALIDVPLIDTVTPDLPAIDLPVMADVSPGDLLPARPIAPISSSMVSVRRPLFRWELASGSDGVRVDVCRERSCVAPVLSFDATGTSSLPPSDLPSGVLFWRLRGRVGAVTGLSAGAVWEMTVSQSAATVASAWGSTFDVNADGRSDFVVAASARSMVAGAAHVHLGSGSGVSMTASTNLIGLDGPGTGFANTLASAGDINGDGFTDLLIGTLGGGSVPPRAYLHFGGSAGLATSSISAVSRPEGIGGRYGVTVAAAGDVNADGYADAILGVADAARADVYYGSVTGIAATPSVSLIGPTATGSLFGASATGACDFDADGIADIVVGSPGADRVDVFRGGRAGVGASGLALLNPEAANRSFGIAVVCIGDTNRDGYPDLAVGSPLAAGGGKVFIYQGGAGGLATSPTRVITGPDGVGRSFGAALGGGGDIDGDGSADLIVGGAAGSIRVHVYFGSSTGLPGTPGVSLAAPADNAGSFGVSVASVGDVNADGFGDVLVGSGAETATPGVGTYPGSGRAYLYLGRASGLAATPVVTLYRPFGEFGFYGAVVAQRGGAAGSWAWWPHAS